MAVVPSKPIDKVQFYEDHVAPFTTNAIAIGLTSTECTDLGAKSTAARAAYNAQQSAQQVARAATETFHNTVDTLGTTGAALLKKIRAKAEQTGNPDVYALARIPAPAVPSPRPAPGKPTDLKVTLDGNGALILTWKCPNPVGSSGTIYQIYRAVGSSEDFAYLGGVGTRKYTDSTVPAGATRLTYQIQAARSTAVGLWATFIVSFGSGGGSGAASVESVNAAMAPKMAA